MRTGARPPFFFFADTFVLEMGVEDFVCLVCGAGGGVKAPTEACSATAKAASPFTMLAHDNSTPLRFPLSVTFSASFVNVTTYSRPSIVKARLRVECKGVVIGSRLGGRRSPYPTRNTGGVPPKGDGVDSQRSRLFTRRQFDPDRCVVACLLPAADLSVNARIDQTARDR